MSVRLLAMIGALVLSMVAQPPRGEEAQLEQSSAEQSSVEEIPVEQIFVMGDSLSDTGNAAAVADYLLNRPFYPQHTIGLCNPADIYLFSRRCDDIVFQQSRVTDGPVAVETLAAELGLPPLVASFHTVPRRPVTGTNYAVASATARGTGVEDLWQQVEMLQLDHGPVLPAGGLYVVMIGGNDVTDALRAAAQSPPGERAEAMELVVTRAVEAIGESVARLIDSGARYLMIANVPNLALVPAVRLRAQQRGMEVQTTLQLAERAAEVFNRLLSERLAAVVLARPAARLVTFDLRGAFEAEYLLAQEEGRNVTNACFDSEGYRRSVLARRRFHPDCLPIDGEAPRFDQFLFWDALHPTGAAHAALGLAMAEAWRR